MMFRKIFSLKRYCSWFVDTIICRLKTKKSDKINLFSFNRVLILAPHSDDEWIGCSQIIRSDIDVLICNMDMQGGDTDELHQARFREMFSLAQKFNRELVTVNPKNRAESLKLILQKYRPQVVFVPFFCDWHEEHVQVMHVLKEVSAFINDFQVGMYPVSLPMLPDFITHYRPMNKRTLKSKWEIFLSSYKSQTFLPWRRFWANERINGAVVGRYAAEVYSLLSIDEWKKLIENHLLSDFQKTILRKELNCIRKVKLMVDLYYKKGADNV